ncbi:glycosyltransferase family 39 protein [Candidatus Woesebacteria bacterium]|nr:glycosyltransferase family 39 protein [Candidatus Woesebacteria bacterium]
MSLDKKAILLITLAFLARVINLNQSLWLDETTTANVVMRYGYLDIITKFSPHDFHPPLYYLFVKFWTNIFGYSEIALRMPSVIASLLTGWVVYQIVVKSIRSIKSVKSTAIWAAAFFLFNPLVVYYSQEARMYAIVTLLVTLIFWSVTKLPFGSAQGKLVTSYKFKGRQIILANIFIALSLATFYGSIFFIASLYLYLVIKKEFKLLTYLLPGTVLASTILSPLFIVQLKNSGEVLKAIPNWSLTLGKANLKNLFLIPIKLTSGRISFEPKWLYYGISGVWVAYIGYWLARLGLQTKKYDQYFFYLKMPVFLGFAISFYKPLLQYFRFIYILPFFSMLLAVAIYKSWHRYLMVGGFIVFSLIYLLGPSFHREDWKSLVADLPSNHVCSLPSSFDPLHYYNSKLITSDARSCTTSKGDVIVVPYAEEIYGFDTTAYMKQKKYILSKEVSFRGVEYQIWKR